MSTTRTFCLLFTLTSLAPEAARAAERGRLNLFGQRFSVVVGAKAFVPESAETRDVYKDVQFAPDLRLWHFDSRKGAAFAYDLGFTRLKGDDASADFISTGLGVRFVLADPDRPVVPYWIVRAGPYFPKVSGRGRTTTAGGSTELGASIADRLVVAARYDLMGRVHGVRLSGFTGRVGIRVF